MSQEELIDSMTLETLILQMSDKHKRITEIGQELFADGSIGALENLSFVLKNRIVKEIEKDPSQMRSLWNGLTGERSIKFL